MSDSYKETARELAKMLRDIAKCYDAIADAPNQQAALFSTAKLGGAMLGLEDMGGKSQSMMENLLKGSRPMPGGRN